MSAAGNICELGQIQSPVIGRDKPSFLEVAKAAARHCGVTRLADITRLDRIGLPVWQAVRPAGKSLSVHQGKAASHVGAQIGALCEAIEAHCAENVPADGPYCQFDALEVGQRAPDLADYCKARDRVPPDDPVQWCEAQDLATGATRYLPDLLVSLDYRTGVPSAFERESSGLGAGATEADALRTSLFEIIERDAIGEWRRLAPEVQCEAGIDPGAIPLDWFQAWRDRLACLGIRLEIYAVPSIVGVPVFMCIAAGRAEFGTAYRAFSGSAADGDPETALFKALAEALQSRLTLIAGVRDDILPDLYLKNAQKEPPPFGCVTWEAIASVQGGVARVVERLAARGYDEVLVKRLDESFHGVAVTKAFVPGLGSLTRTRRPPR